MTTARSRSVGEPRSSRHASTTSSGRDKPVRLGAPTTESGTAIGSISRPRGRGGPRSRVDSCRLNRVRQLYKPVRMGYRRGMTFEPRSAFPVHAPVPAISTVYRLAPGEYVTAFRVLV